MSKPTHAVRSSSSSSSSRPLPPPSEPSSTVEPAAEPVPRLAITLKPDGSIDWDRMRESTKTKLVDLARHDPRLHPSAAPAGAVVVDVFSEQWCGIIYDALGQMEASIIARVYHVTAEQAAVMCYTDAEKRILTGPTQKVLNKYAASWLTSYTDEAALIIALGTIHISKLQQLRAEVERASRPTASIVPMPARDEGENER